MITDQQLARAKIKCSNLSLDRPIKKFFMKFINEVERLNVQVNAPLNHCDKEAGECSECSKIICPHKDPLHFHHDGCPSCAEQEPTHE